MQDSSLHGLTKDNDDRSINDDPHAMLLDTKAVTGSTVWAGNNLEDADYRLT